MLSTFACLGCYMVFNWLLLGLLSCWPDQIYKASWVKTILAICFLALETLWALSLLPFFCLWLFVHFVKILSLADTEVTFLEGINICVQPAILHQSLHYKICENLLLKWRLFIAFRFIIQYIFVRLWLHLLFNAYCKVCLTMKTGWFFHSLL